MKTAFSGFGSPRSKNARDLRDRTGLVRMKAEDEADACILAAIYGALYSDRFPALTKSIRAAANKLYKIKGDVRTKAIKKSRVKA